MSHNPELQPSHQPTADSAIQPDAPDFVETSEVAPLSSEHEPLPIWLYLICGFALFMAGSSFTGFGIFGLGLCDQGPGGPALAGANGPAVEVAEDPLTLGKKIYGGSCSNCHQATGVGQPGSYPPLVDSEWVLGQPDKIIRIVTQGLSGPIEVEGSKWQLEMPGLPIFTDEQIAGILTYIRREWEHTGSAVEPSFVTSVRAAIKDHTKPWTSEELQKPVEVKTVSAK